MSHVTTKPRTFKTIILEDLRRRGLDIIAKKVTSITYETFSMGNAVRVDTVDLFKAERQTLTTILDGYAYGRFDGMTDASWSEQDKTKERQAKYVTLNNRFSAPLEALAKQIDDRNGWSILTALESYDDALKLLEDQKPN